ncbi:olfactory receptor 5P55-like [Hyperolius riggenbachi]|uniref:olfactory receptor 5P55-like n=1 Tax=Hyperolius riggenbachi TaxID=752182 RepID=UPI0035A2FC7A
MDMKNMTRISSIHIFGFQTRESISCLVFFLFLMVYSLTVCGNFLIIMLVSSCRILHSPMYFFLTQLSVSDIILVTSIVPNIFQGALLKEFTLSLSDCITQFYFFATAGTAECFLLTVMSYDRYLAICKPLHYNLIMSHFFCWMTVLACWTLSILALLLLILKIIRLEFCGPDILDHFFCDLHPILELSCTDISSITVHVMFTSTFFVVIPFIIIITSYVCIIVAIFRIPSITGRQKAFSTCSSHLTVVFIYYGTLICVYLVPSGGQSLNVSKFLSLMYTVVTPLMNPIIYSLRNKELKKAFEQLTSSLSTENKLMR